MILLRTFSVAFFFFLNLLPGVILHSRCFSFLLFLRVNGNLTLGRTDHLIQCSILAVHENPLLAWSRYYEIYHALLMHFRWLGKKSTPCLPVCILDFVVIFWNADLECSRRTAPSRHLFAFPSDPLSISTWWVPVCAHLLVFAVTSCFCIYLENQGEVRWAV